jgi:uncharacterized membrane protein YuzA (DUF378 family)
MRRRRGFDFWPALWPIALVLLVIGAINWGVIGLFDENLIKEVFSNRTLVDIIYVAIGVAGVLAIPRLLDEF